MIKAGASQGSCGPQGAPAQLHFASALVALCLAWPGRPEARTGLSHGSGGPEESAALGGQGRDGPHPPSPLLRICSSLLLAFLEEGCVCASVWLAFI